MRTKNAPKKQDNTDNGQKFVISKTDFSNQLAELAPKMSFTPGAKNALQTAAEGLMEDMFRSAGLVAAANGKIKVEMVHLEVIKKHFMNV
ncbi:Histone H2A/H2B/H3 domain-containing protein [Caenorhabditis elegans]|uniref:Histone H2A/H2B/H3 domain-containing protein n=1 Tax=Caenorhabditis elegans TaxID=6239 RepID=E0R7K9_CAEEL|nr:Histone H2A/H2B/H3 domain-containing protein [Caenorhabditis elegans]CBW48330.1 Histone H2A/H2B/H3 domain-containing protein [Caenorhabditis elegans]|eukprot:NP_001252258.1 Uncharacterized protein CELE_Y71A12B.23 [Caenorhabditis elegans]